MPKPKAKSKSKRKPVKKQSNMRSFRMKPTAWAALNSLAKKVEVPVSDLIRQGAIEFAFKLLAKKKGNGNEAIQH